MAHSAAAKERAQHHALVSRYLTHLHFEAVQGLLLLLQLPGARNVFHFVFIQVVYSCKLVAHFLLLVVQMLHSVNDLPQFHSMLLFPKCDLVQLGDLLFVLSVDSLFTSSDFGQFLV